MFGDEGHGWISVTTIAATPVQGIVNITGFRGDRGSGHRDGPGGSCVECLPVVGDPVGEVPHECPEKVLAALDGPAVEDVMMRPAQADEVQGVAETRTATHTGRFDMRSVSPGFMAARDQAFDALPADDRLDQLQVAQRQTWLRRSW